MRLFHKTLIVPSAFVAIALMTAPVFAGQQNREGRGTAVPRGQSERRNGGDQQPAQRQGAPRQETPRARSHRGRTMHSANRAAPVHRAAPGQRAATEQRADRAIAAAIRAVVRRSRPGGPAGLQLPGRTVLREHTGRYGNVRDYSRSFSRSGYFAPRLFSRPLYRPYYSFRPSLRLGFGIYLGYPVAYPSDFDSYLPTAYSADRPGIPYGGVSFDIQPYDAEIYVDGDYAGVVRDFGPYAAPLTLPAGLHHIDLDAPGFEPLSFDLTIVPRQVIPYQGSLPRF